MMTLTNIKKLLIWIGSIMLIFSCEKNLNYLPYCKFIAPNDLQTFIIGDTISIVIDAFDNNGSVEEITLLINDKVVSSISNSSLQYEWITSNDTAGIYRLEARVIDNENATGKSSIFIELEEYTGPPTIVIDSIYNITEISVSVSCSILDSGNLEMEELFFSLDTFEYPSDESIWLTVYDIPIHLDVELTGLTPKTDYFLRVFACNTKWCASSQQVEFTTLVSTNKLQLTDIIPWPTQTLDLKPFTVPLSNDLSISGI